MDHWSQLYFGFCAALAIAGALVTVIAPNPIRGAMGLLMMILSVAGLFLALHAQFLAAVQLIVYAGAIVVLFLFVIMLLGPDASPPHDKRGRFSRTVSGALFALVAISMLALVIHGGSRAALPPTADDFGSIDQFGRQIFSYALVPFELSSALLMVAVLGAVAVARGNHVVRKKRDSILKPQDASADAPDQRVVSAHLPGDLEPRGGR
jgi:NADH-quinone oxidoreductase subunit J